MKRQDLSLPIHLTPDGLVIHVLAKPKASRNAIIGTHDGRLKVAVTVAPEKGKATAAVLAVIAEALRLKRSQVSLSAGETTPLKSVLVTGIGVDELQRRIVAVLAELGVK